MPPSVQLMTTQCCPPVTKLLHAACMVHMSEMQRDARGHICSNYSVSQKPSFL